MSVADLSIAEARNRPEIDEAVQFTLDELFFSRTDLRGVIVSGNEVFQRVSRYSWDELVGKPHKIIRHPHTPRAVFWLLWDQLKKGNPVGAYVKNRAKDGRYYWVFAIVTPTEGGYLSVRLKPTALLSAVEPLYETIRALELGERISPEESALALLREVKSLGFEDYGAFMASALSEEIAARDKALLRAADLSLHQFADIVQCGKRVVEESGSIFNAFAKNQYVPLNLTIQASQLGEAGAAIGVISTNYNTMSNQIKESMTKFVSSAHEVLSAAYRGLFLVATARIQNEVADLFDKETDARNRVDELPILVRQALDYREKATAGLTDIARRNDLFHATLLDMKRLTSNLAVTRIMGKIESAHLKAAQTGLDALMNSLADFQSHLTVGLGTIERLAQDISARARRPLHAEPGAARPARSNTAG